MFCEFTRTAPTAMAPLTRFPLRGSSLERGAGARLRGIALVGNLAVRGPLGERNRLRLMPFDVHGGHEAIRENAADGRVRLKLFKGAQSVDSTEVDVSRRLRAAPISDGRCDDSRLIG
jgi:hypothetical protein